MITNNLKTIMRYKMSPYCRFTWLASNIYETGYGSLINTCGEDMYEYWSSMPSEFLTISGDVTNLSREDDLELDANSPEKAEKLSGTTTTKDVGTFILVGSGTAEPSSSDYKLENCISDLTDCGQYIAMSSVNLFSVNRILRNDTNEDVVINEVGLYNRPAYSPNNKGRTKFLLAREVLPETVTLHPGDSYTFTISLTI